MRNTYVTPAFFIISMFPACGGEARDAARTDAESAATVSEGTAEAAQIGTWFSDTAALNAARATVGEARALMTAAAEGEIRAAVSPPACVAVTTDSQTYVQATFTGCTGPGGRASMSGSVRGELSFDTTPCGPAMCPTAARWTIAADLTYGDGGAIDGDIAVVAPISSEASRTLVATLAVTSLRGDTVEAGADATWTADEAGCATVSGSASVTGETSGTVAVTGLATCPDACPTAGTVTMSGSGGRTLSFAYDGSATITVVTGTGESFELPLLCRPSER